MEFPKIPDGQMYVFKLSRIHALISGIDHIDFDEVDETEYRAAIHFEGIGFYDIVRINRKTIKEKNDIGIAIACLDALSKKDTDEVLIAASKKSIKYLQ